MSTELRTDPDYYDAIAAGRKRAEVRLADRDYCTGALLRLVRWEWGRGFVPLPPARGGYDASRLNVRVLHVIRLHGTIVPERAHWWRLEEVIQHGVVVMSISLDVPEAPSS